MAKKNTVPIRIDGSIADTLNKIGDIRVTKGLANRREMTMPEITRLLGKTNGWKMSIEELKTKPKRIEFK